MPKILTSLTGGSQGLFMYIAGPFLGLNTAETRLAQNRGWFNVFNELSFNSRSIVPFIQASDPAF